MDKKIAIIILFLFVILISTTYCYFMPQQPKLTIQDFFLKKNTDESHSSPFNDPYIKYVPVRYEDSLRFDQLEPEFLNIAKYSFLIEELVCGCNDIDFERKTQYEPYIDRKSYDSPSFE